MGLNRRQFQDMALRYELPRVKINNLPGNPVFYDPAAVQRTAEERHAPQSAQALQADQPQQASQAAPKKASRQKAAPEVIASAAPSVDRPELYRQAMSVMDKIVQGIGRM